MSFFLSPIIFVFELIGFLISAAFVYGLALIVGGVILWYGISTIPKTETEFQDVKLFLMQKLKKNIALLVFGVHIKEIKILLQKLMVLITSHHQNLKLGNNLIMILRNENYNPRKMY